MVRTLARSGDLARTRDEVQAAGLGNVGNPHPSVRATEACTSTLPSWEGSRLVGSDGDLRSKRVLGGDACTIGFGRIDQVRGFARDDGVRFCRGFCPGFTPLGGSWIR